MSTQLKEIKKIHEKANDLFNEDSFSNREEIMEVLYELFTEEHTDWLIEQAEILEKTNAELEIINKSLINIDGLKY